MKTPSELLSVNDLRVALKLPATYQTDDELMQPLIDALHLALEEKTGMVFEGEQTIADEAYSGNGGASLWLRRPIKTLSAVKVGRVLATPDETLDVADAEVLAVDPDHPRRLVRADGGVFPRATRNVFVSYVSAANLPADAKNALRAACEFAYRRVGAGEVTADSIPGYSRSLIAKLDEVPFWREFVERRDLLVL